MVVLFGGIFAAVLKEFFFNFSPAPFLVVFFGGIFAAVIKEIFFNFSPVLLLVVLFGGIFAAVLKEIFLFNHTEITNFLRLLRGSLAPCFF
ncbi:MAG: hypothetical protein IJ718_06195 [Paludibacteraceae bacterium]|nr:hypothetical protein [Paludibacteraceae bacterium]